MVAVVNVSVKSVAFRNNQKEAEKAPLSNKFLPAFPPASSWCCFTQLIFFSMALFHLQTQVVIDSRTHSHLILPPSTVQKVK